MSDALDFDFYLIYRLSNDLELGLDEVVWRRG